MILHLGTFLRPPHTENANIYHGFKRKQRRGKEFFVSPTKAEYVSISCEILQNYILISLHFDTIFQTILAHT